MIFIEIHKHLGVYTHIYTHIKQSKHLNMFFYIIRIQANEVSGNKFFFFGQMSDVTLTNGAGGLQCKS